MKKLKKRFTAIFGLSLVFVMLMSTAVFAYNLDEKRTRTETIKGKGTITAQIKRTPETKKRTSGNSYQWDYEPYGYYTGSEQVDWIKATWYGQACMKSSASFNMGLSGTSVSFSASSSWQYIMTPEKYWKNDNGVKSVYYDPQTAVAAPTGFYYANSFFVGNRVEVKLKTETIASQATI